MGRGNGGGEGEWEWGGGMGDGRGIGVRREGWVEWNLLIFLTRKTIWEQFLHFVVKV